MWHNVAVDMMAVGWLMAGKIPRGVLKWVTDPVSQRLKIDLSIYFHGRIQ